MLGGGSGGGLLSEGDSRGAEGVDVFGLVRDVIGSPRADLVKEGAASMVFGELGLPWVVYRFLGSSCTSCWAICRVSSRVMSKSLAL